MAALKKPADERLKQRVIGITGPQWKAVKEAARLERVSTAAWVRQALAQRLSGV